MRQYIGVACYTHTVGCLTLGCLLLLSLGFFVCSQQFLLLAKANAAICQALHQASQLCHAGHNVV